ncbi:MAG: SDR family oxidoreductase [Acidobacteriota bacterium]
MLGVGRVAIVTGGTRGIGRAISESLASEGMRVVALYKRNHDAARDLAQEAKRRGWTITTIGGDLTREASRNNVVAAVHEAADEVHVVVHAAASGVHRPVAELTARHLGFTFETNVVSIQSLLAELVPKMAAGGRIVGLTSAGSTHTIHHYGAVGASKGALDALLRHWAWELAPRGIAVNLVCPGMVETGALDAFPDRDTRVAGAASRTPTGRLTTSEEVAALVRFLCTPEAAQIIGQTLTIDGGKTLPS